MIAQPPAAPVVQSLTELQTLVHQPPRPSQPPPALASQPPATAEARVAPSVHPPPSSPPEPLPIAELLFQRSEDPSSSSPLTYREAAWAVPEGTSIGSAVRLLAGMFEGVRAALAGVKPGKLVYMAIFDHRFVGKPTRPPLATLTWKDWKDQGQGPEIRRQGEPRASFQPPPVTDSFFPGFRGSWDVVDGTYRSNVVQTAIATAPIFSGDGEPSSTETREYTFRIRMLNPYGGAGNLMGVAFNIDVVTGNYVELVFSPTGVAHLRRFQNGVMSTIATTSYVGARNVPFEVQLENGPDHVGFLVDGQRLFADVTASEVNPQQFPTGFVGIVTHWTPGRFDNARFDHGFFEQPCSFSFANPPPSHWIVSGTWNNDGGTLNNTSTGSSDIVDFKCFGNLSGEDAGTNAVYSARLLNTFGASGNLVGLVYNYQGANSFYAGDYFEVVFSSTGVVQLNKFIQGVRYPVRTRSHTIPRNTFFNVQVFRNGIFTTIKLNGATIVENEPQGELSGGSIGVVTHFSRGRFDNVTLREHVVHPPSEL
jgi:hypothetical protein